MYAIVLLTNYLYMYVFRKTHNRRNNNEPDAAKFQLIVVLCNNEKGSLPVYLFIWFTELNTVKNINRY